MTETQNNDVFGSNFGHTKDEWGIKKKKKKLVNQIIVAYKMSDE